MFDRILAIDLETTGKHHIYDSINQLGVAIMVPGDDGTGEIEQFLQIPRIRPTDLSKLKIEVAALEAQLGPLDESDSGGKIAQWFNHIQSGTPSADAAKELCSFIEKNNASALPIVAQNASFDMGFMAQWKFQQRKTFSSCPFGEMSICTMEMAKRVFKGGSKYDLDTILALCGLPARPEAHEALQDAILCGRAYFTMSKIEKERNK